MRETWEYCEIALAGSFLVWFEARAIGVKGRYVVAQSRKVLVHITINGLQDENSATGEMVAIITNQLIKSGWELMPNKASAKWYSYKFRRLI